MLIKTQFYEGIRDGSITLTFRNWKSPRVKPGQQYRFGMADIIEVDSIEQVPVSSISEHDANNAGFTNISKLIKFLNKNSPQHITKESSVFKVQFHYVQDRKYTPPADNVEITPQAINDVIAKLHKMDRLSKQDPWTIQVLTLIQENPQTASSQLAHIMQRDRQTFKSDVRKLKKLGLTVSFEVGYELSAFGEAVLNRIKSKN